MNAADTDAVIFPVMDSVPWCIRVMRVMTPPPSTLRQKVPRV